MGEQDEEKRAQIIKLVKGDLKGLITLAIEIDKMHPLVFEEENVV